MNKERIRIEGDNQMSNQKDIKNMQYYENRKHGDLGFPMKIYWNDFTTYVAESIPWHWHEEIEFAVVMKGMIEISVGTINTILHKGEAIFINADMLHQMKPYGKEKAYMFTIVAHPSILGIEKGFLLSSKYVTPFINNEFIKTVILQSEIMWQQSIITLLKEMYVVNEEKKYGYEYKLHNALCEIWYTLLQNAWKEQKETVRYKENDEIRIYQALSYIQVHYMDSVALEDICKELNISKSECCRCFKRNLKMSPFEYLMIHRVSIASRLLEKTNDTITEIAMNTGFNSNSYFCKIFKKYMNSTPIEYRKKTRLENNK